MVVRHDCQDVPQRPTGCPHTSHHLDLAPVAEPPEEMLITTGAEVAPSLSLRPSLALPLPSSPPTRCLPEFWFRFTTRWIGSPRFGSDRPIVDCSLIYKSDPRG
ncbi:hypothetical protein J6590_013248 [Homalodisca vitripennis]|nr:hypothetical protein J6590_013248 [Homalodisca vitripennis]